MRPSASDGCSEEIQVGGGYVLVKGEVNVVGAEFKDVVVQLGGAVVVIKIVVGFFEVKNVVVRGRSGSRRRHEDD